MPKKMIKFCFKCSENEVLFQILEQRESTRRTSLITVDVGDDFRVNGDSGFDISGRDYPAITYGESDYRTELYLRGRLLHRDSRIYSIRCTIINLDKFRNNFLTAMSTWADFVRENGSEKRERLQVDPRVFLVPSDNIYEF